MLEKIISFLNFCPFYSLLSSLISLTKRSLSFKKNDFKFDGQVRVKPTHLTYFASSLHFVSQRHVDHTAGESVNLQYLFQSLREK